MIFKLLNYFLIIFLLQSCSGGRVGNFLELSFENIKEDELKSIEKKIDLEITQSVQNALEAPDPKPEELTKYIWAED